jgi:hypothetical protein
MLLSLIRLTLQRQAKYSKLEQSTDLSKVNSLDCFFILAPLIKDMVSGDIKCEDLETSY